MVRPPGLRVIQEKQAGGKNSIIRKFFFGGRRGMRGHANHCGAQHAAMKHVAGLQFSNHRSVRKFRSFDALDGVMKMRIEMFAGGFDALQPLFRERVPELAMDELETLALFRERRAVHGGKSSFKSIENGQKLLDEYFHAAMAVLLALFFDALAVVLEIGLAAHERIEQLLLFGLELLDLLGERNVTGGELRGFRVRRCCGGCGRVRDTWLGTFFFFVMRWQECQLPSWFSEKNWAMKATAVITRS
jgi:hypothetical protein